MSRTMDLLFARSERPPAAPAATPRDPLGQAPEGSSCFHPKAHGPGARAPMAPSWDLPGAIGGGGGGRGDGVALRSPSELIGWSPHTTRLPERGISSAVEEIVGVLRRKGLDTDADRLERCFDGLVQEVSWCSRCGRAERLFYGRCGHRSCLFDHGHYHRRKAREYLDLLGPAPFYWQVVLTIPPFARARHEGARFTERVAELDDAMRARWPGLGIAAFVQLHQSGKRRPHRHHPHYNVVGASRFLDLDTGREVLRRKGRMPLDLVQREVRWLIRKAWGASSEHYHADYRFKPTLALQRFCLRYVIRSQGDGDPIARCVWQPPRLQLLRPLGILRPRTGDRERWRQFNPWGEGRDEAVGSGWEADTRGSSTCCRAPFLEREGDRERRREAEARSAEANLDVSDDYEE